MRDRQNRLSSRKSSTVFLRSFAAAMMFRLLLVFYLFQLSVGQTPGTINLRLTGSSETSISVAWDNVSADGYNLTWRANSPFPRPPMNVIIYTSNYTIVGLHEGTTYNVTVRSVNNIGSENFTTKATAPSSPPTAFTVTVLSDTSLRLNWSAPPDDNWNDLSLRGFNYYCVVRNTSSNTFSNCTSGNTSFQNDTDDYSRDVTGLDQLTEYLCSVSATNSQGSSPYAREISVTTTGTDNGFFQLSFHGSFDCQEWIRNYGRSSSLFTDLTHYIRRNCNCNFNRNGGMIDRPEVSCRGGPNDKVVVRARLVAPTDSSFSSILSLIEEWKYSAKSVLVEGQRLDIDLSCPAALDSLNDPDCFNLAGAIAGGVLGSLIGIVLIAVAVVTVVCIIRKCWWVKRKKSLLEPYHSKVHVKNPKSKYDSHKVHYTSKPQVNYKEPKVEKPPVSKPAPRQTMQVQNPTIPHRSFNTSTAPSGPVYYEAPDDVDTDLYECGDFGNEGDYDLAT